MEQILSPKEFQRQYRDMLSALYHFLPASDLQQQFRQEVDPFLRLCALGVWQSNGTPISTTHVEYYNCLHSPDGEAPNILFWELVSAVDRYEGFVLPALFHRLCRHDEQLSSALSERFAYDLTLILLLFAAVDGSVSPQELRFIETCADRMESQRRERGLPARSRFVPLNDFLSSQPAPTAPAATGTKPETPAEEQPRTLDELLAELDALHGLKEVKRDVHSLLNLVRIRQLRKEQELPNPPLSLHMVFTGNPGTGKTTVARLMAELYRAAGVLSKGQLVEVDRSGLVAGFVGQTALKTGEAIQRALGGVLFIDEAYALTNQKGANDFGMEAIEILLKGMEDNREDLVVIVAGYTDLMEGFLRSNPGLESRFNKRLHFPDYNGSDLMAIFEQMCKRHGFTLNRASRTTAEILFADLYKNRRENFANARYVRNIFEQALARQANRLAQLDTPDKTALMELSSEDLDLPMQGKDPTAPGF